MTNFCLFYQVLVAGGAEDRDYELLTADVDELERERGRRSRE